MKLEANLWIGVSVKVSDIGLLLDFGIYHECAQCMHTQKHKYIRVCAHLFTSKYTCKFNLHSDHDRANGKCQQHAGHSRGRFGTSSVSV